MISASPRPGALRVAGLQGQHPRHPRLRRFHRRSQAALRWPTWPCSSSSAVDGVEVQTEMIWRVAADLGIPRLIFMNKLDRDRASFHDARPAPGQVRRGHRPARVAHRRGDRVPRHGRPAHRQGLLLRAAARTTEAAIPDELRALEHEVHDSLVEGIVVADDDACSTVPRGRHAVARRARAHAGRRASPTARFSPSCADRRDGRDRPPRRLHLRDRPVTRRPPRRRRSRRRRRAAGRRRSGRPTAGVRVQDDRRPLRRQDLAVQGAVGHR